jgi:hypothetical protein
MAICPFISAITKAYSLGATARGRIRDIPSRWQAAPVPCRSRSSHFTDVERWTAWQGVGGKVDARAGGTLRVIMPDAAAASGHFIEVVPPRRAVFTWGPYDL